MNDKAIGNDSLKTTIMEYLVSPGVRIEAAWDSASKDFRRRQRRTG